MRIVLASIMAMLALSCNMDKGAGKLPVLGTDAVEVSVHETQPEAYAALSGGGGRGATLLLMSSYIDLGQTTGSQPSMRGALASGALGDIYWVVPEPLFDDIVNAERDIKAYLNSRETGLNVSEAGGMKFNEGCLEGSVSGGVLHVCNAANLPVIDGPVWLLVDASFFASYADSRGLNKLGALRQSLESMFKRGYRDAAAAVSYGVAAGRTRVIHRHLGDVAAEVIRSPQVMTDAPPALWLARDRAELLFARRIDEALTVTLAESMGLYPEDPVIGLINASFLVRQGRFDDALAAGEAVCHRDPDYCMGLQYLGYVAGLDGQMSWQQKFTARAMELGVHVPGRLYYAARPEGGR